MQMTVVELRLQNAVSAVLVLWASDAEEPGVWPWYVLLD